VLPSFNWFKINKKEEDADTYESQAFLELQALREPSTNLQETNKKYVVTNI
jgi:hypothetical protein